MSEYSLTLSLGEVAELVGVLGEHMETVDVLALHDKFRQAMVNLAHGHIEALGILVVGAGPSSEGSKLERFKQLIMAERKLKRIVEILQSELTER